MLELALGGRPGHGLLAAAARGPEAVVACPDVRADRRFDREVLYIYIYMRVCVCVCVCVCKDFLLTLDIYIYI